MLPNPLVTPGYPHPQAAAAKSMRFDDACGLAATLAIAHHCTPLHTIAHHCTPLHTCTGYLTLRFCGLEPELASEKLCVMRPVTHKELVVSHVRRWGAAAL